MAEIILGIGVLVLALFIVPLMFRPFQAGPRSKKRIRQRSDAASLSEISRGIPDGASQNNPQRVCVERARGRVLIGSVASFFILLFTGIALMARAGKIQPREVAR